MITKIELFLDGNTAIAFEFMKVNLLPFSTYDELDSDDYANLFEGFIISPPHGKAPSRCLDDIFRIIELWSIATTHGSSSDILWGPRTHISMVRMGHQMKIALALGDAVATLSQDIEKFKQLYNNQVIGKVTRLVHDIDPHLVSGLHSNIRVL